MALLNTTAPTNVTDAAAIDDTEMYDESRAVYAWCVPIDILGITLVALVLSLSAVRHRAKFNLGPRIFTVNMMLLDAVHAVVSFLYDYPMTNVRLLGFMQKTGLRTPVFKYADFVRSFGMLAFNCSLLPMMVMSIVACYSTQRISDKVAAWRFAGIALVSDAVPLVIQVVNAATATGPITWSSPLYMSATFTLYIGQLVVSVVALSVLYRKSNGYVKNSNKKDDRASKNLARLIMFTAGPCLLQVPFAVYLVVHEVVDVDTELHTKMSYAVRLIFALKPTIDAIFTLAFLGEYRQYTLNFYRFLRKKATGQPSGAAVTRVSELHQRPSMTRSVMPSVYIGQAGGVGRTARSASLPICVAHS
ncbi:hypothetical protein AAVH_18224 [Aphelenchoides avenae]|nr:hypothetical protein AAVH_18224 [Aphelenchus avenae]